MGEKEVESCAFLARGSCDCMHASVCHCGVRSRTQPCESRLLRTADIERQYIKNVEEDAAIVVGKKITESIKSEFINVERPKSVSTASLLENGAVNGFKRAILTRDENRTSKSEVVVVGSTVQCEVISRVTASDSTSNEEFQIHCTSTSPPLGQPKHEIVPSGTILASTREWSDIHKVNRDPLIGADRNRNYFQRCPAVIVPLIDNKTSLAILTQTASDPLCAQAELAAPRAGEGSADKQKKSFDNEASTGAAETDITYVNQRGLNTYCQASTSLVKVELEVVTSSVEGENSQEKRCGVTDGSVDSANNTISTLKSNTQNLANRDRQTVPEQASSGEMGNIPLLRSQRERNSPVFANNEQSIQPSSDGTVDCGRIEDQRSSIQNCAIPMLVVSDSSVDPEQTGAMSAQEDETGQNPPCKSTAEVEAKGIGDGKKPLLRPLRSMDSAYNSDSTRTSVDCVSLSESRVGDGEFSFQDTTSLLSPPTITVDAKSASASSSSSSSPSHAALGSSAGSLRVMSDVGLRRKLSSSSGSSFRSSLSLESEDDVPSSDGELRDGMALKGSKQTKAQNRWIKVKRMMIWTPFMQSYKKNYPWVQLAGHAGNFKPGEEGCILKKYCQREAESLSRLSKDVHLRPYVPVYHGVVDKDRERYMRMQDLLLAFDCPSVMDCKMGVRTYLEDELVKAKIKPRLRHDMYMKMTEISPEEPTAEEHERKAVTKPRYMQWREHVSSSSNLAFRVEGIKKGDRDPSKDYKLTKTKDQIKCAFRSFIHEKADVLEKYIERLKDIRSAAEESEFFMTHEVIGSSLLFVHDPTGAAGVWMIDFGKTTRLPDDKRLTHREEWVEGNREDGYLVGMDNLIDIFQEILNELSSGGGQECCAPASERCVVDHPLAVWAMSSQSSGESFDLGTQDIPPVVAATDAAAVDSPRKPPLKRQVAASYSYDDTLKPNGDVTIAKTASGENGEKTDCISPSRADNVTATKILLSEKT